LKLESIEAVSAAREHVFGPYVMGPYEGPFVTLLGILFVLIILFTVIVLVLWIALPFSVFGVKGLLKKAVKEQEKTNEYLRRLVEKEKGTED